MSLILFYDTETTGLPDFKAPSEMPHQPHIVQLGAVLVDETTREELAVLDVIIRPDGWEISDEAAAVHGITMERALAEGIPEAEAVEQFMAMWQRCCEAGGGRVAHNEKFDARILRIALMRFANVEQADAWKEGPARCTCVAATPILNLPPTEKMIRAGFGRKPKQANLGEAFEFFTGRPLEGAHSAIVDVRACATVHWAIQDGIRERVTAVDQAAA